MPMATPTPARRPTVAGFDDRPALTAPERFEVFYAREYHGAVLLAYALAGSWAAAEDIAQEAMLAALRAWDRVGRYEHTSRWLRRTVANMAVSSLRRRLAEGRALVRLAARPHPTPELADDAVEYWRAVRTLPRRQAQTVALHYLEGLTTAEIAVVLGCSDATVRVHLHHARLALARRLRPGTEEGP
jgi:RNA polymerase sigma-70 factor, ECF subfamily